MHSRLLVFSALAICSGPFLRAAEPRLVDLLMPDAQVLAGVNVRQSAGSPLGRYVLATLSQRSQMARMSEFGFNLRQVREAIVATNGGPKYDTGVAVARGGFHPADTIAKAKQKGAITEVYKNVTVLEDAKQTFGLAFLGSKLAIAGDIASIKSALDRHAQGAVLPAALAAQIAQLAATQDAWAISQAPLSNLIPQTAVPATAAPMFNPQGILQNFKAANGGVKFGKMAAVTAQAHADSPDTAKLMGDTLKLLVNLAQTQSKTASLLNLESLVVNPQGADLNISFSVSDATFRKLMRSFGGADKKAGPLP